jgi:hypothetical protein
MRVYELFINDEMKDGLDAISVVGSPAMESQFVALKKEEKKQTFAKVDDKKKILMGVIMKPNKKIYRYDEQSKEEYEVFFSEQTVRRASELYFKNNKQRNFNVEHNSKDTLEAYLVESWIVEDPKKDKSAIYGLDAEKGDWVGAMKFDSDEDYQRALESGTGFSLEGVFSEKVILNKVSNMDFKQMKDEIVNELKSLFSKSVKLAQANLKEGAGVIEFEGDMPTVGTPLSLVTPEGTVPAPAGEYTLEDETVIIVGEDGNIAEVKEKQPEAEVEVEVEQAKEVAPTTAMDSTGELKDMISSILVKFGEDLKAELTNHIETKFSEATKKVEDLKVELSKQPAVEKTKVAPIEKEVKMASTSRGRLLESLNNLKNK